jgi:hypothetical protein
VSRHGGRGAASTKLLSGLLQLVCRRQPVDRVGGLVGGTVDGRVLREEAFKRVLELLTSWLES